MRRGRLSSWWWLAVLGVVATVGRAAGPFAPPTPSTAWLEGAPLATWVQPTQSGEETSALFGCVRSGGSQFHEGLDIRPVRPRDRHGEATDPVFAAADGIVRHVSRVAGKSSYGRYIVIEHPHLRPAVVTLYAHLARVPAEVRPGLEVKQGQEIATMGRSAGGYTIPKDRAHLHFEVALRLTDDFQAWYDFRKFGSANDHGRWNGMNLVGLDPLDLLTRLRDGRVRDLADYFAQEAAAPAVRLRVATLRTPDLAKRYPVLLTREPLGLIGGWEVALSRFGVPVALTPLERSEVEGYRDGEVRVVEHDAEQARACRCKSLVEVARGTASPGRDATTVLQLLFGLRK